jgi:S1-C subfamily serine protease
MRESDRSFILGVKGTLIMPSNFSEDLAPAAEKAGASVVTVRARHRIPSSGIYWREGVIVTAEHAVRRDEEISILVSDQKQISAKLAGRDPGTDIAILKIEGNAGLKAPQFADPSSLKLAHPVLALGRTRAGNLAASAGIIGALSGAHRTWRGGQVDRSIRLSLELYPGFSGGPLLNTAGEVIGMNTAIGHGRPVTIPVSTVNRVADELLAKGYIARPYLGIAMQPVSLPESQREKLKAAVGLMVVHVESPGPADKAGIVLGDVIVELQGKPATDVRALMDSIASARVGDGVNLKIVRAGERKELTLTLGERPAK